jgi:hypothetical protein
MSVIQKVNSYIAVLQGRGIDDYTSATDFEHTITDENIPHFLNSKYRVVKMRGDGLCWINSLLGSIFGRFWKNPIILNKWFEDITTTMKMYDENFKFCFGLLEMNIQYRCSSLVSFLNRNLKVLSALAHNIISFCVHNYTDLQINVNCPMTDINYCIDIEEGGFRAIDFNMRNFVMNVCGVERVRVFQYKTDPTSQRSNDPQNKTTRLLENSSYAGFLIESFGTVNVGGYIGTIDLYSYDSSHYDAFCLCNDRDITAMISDIEERLSRTEGALIREIMERREAEKQVEERLRRIEESFQAENARRAKEEKDKREAEEERQLLEEIRRIDEATERREAERREAERREAERREAVRREAERREAEIREAERRDAERREAEEERQLLEEIRRIDEAVRREAERREAEIREAEEERQLLEEIRRIDEAVRREAERR